MSEKFELTLNGRAVEIRTTVHRTSEPACITPEFVDKETGEVIAVLWGNNLVRYTHQLESFNDNGWTIMGSLTINHGDWSINTGLIYRERFQEIKKQCNTSQ